jgi:hypothetical protein
MGAIVNNNTGLQTFCKWTAVVFEGGWPFSLGVAEGFIFQGGVQKLPRQITAGPPLACIPHIEAFIYALILLGTLGVLLFAIFFRDPPRIS